MCCRGRDSGHVSARTCTRSRHSGRPRVHAGSARAPLSRDGTATRKCVLCDAHACCYICSEAHQLNVRFCSARRNLVLRARKLHARGACGILHGPTRGRAGGGGRSVFVVPSKGVRTAHTPQKFFRACGPEKLIRKCRICIRNSHILLLEPFRKGLILALPYIDYYFVRRGLHCYKLRISIRVQII